MFTGLFPARHFLFNIHAYLPGQWSQLTLFRPREIRARQLHLARLNLRREKVVTSEKSHRPSTRVISAAAAMACCAAVVTAAGPASASTSTNYSTATSIAAFGGMSGLVKAAKSEGALNVITLPDNWCNYGAIINSFSKKYGISINSENPDGSSQDEINAMTQLKGQSREPDVLDMGTPFAIKADQMHLLTPYTVSSWGNIAASAKAPDKTWWADYGGYVAIGYNSAVVKTPPTSFKSLLNPIYKHMVGINNSPTEAGAAFAAVYAAALANGGSLGDIGPGSAISRSSTRKAISSPSYPGHPRSRAGPLPS